MLSWLCTFVQNIDYHFFGVNNYYEHIFKITLLGTRMPGARLKSRGAIMDVFLLTGLCYANLDSRTPLSALAPIIKGEPPKRFRVRR